MFVAFQDADAEPSLINAMFLDEAIFDFHDLNKIHLITLRCGTGYSHMISERAAAGELSKTRKFVPLTN